jgi:uncharacterized protein YcbK (DUF882 family)
VQFKFRAVRFAFVGFVIFFFIVPAVAALASPIGPDAAANRQYRLRFFQIHTGEKLDVVYRKGNSYVPEALVELDHLLRDYRNGEVHHYDPRLFDLLYELLDAAERPGAWINVVCGYRNPQTNAYLRSHGHGVAMHSLHMQAMAIDIRLPGTSTAMLRDLALALRAGGVGYYAASDFIHVDVGRVRRW